MSFYCRYMTGRDYCSRRDLECRPGAEGCVLRGKVVFAESDDHAAADGAKGGRGPDAERRTRRRPGSAATR